MESYCTLLLNRDDGTGRYSCAAPPSGRSVSTASRMRRTWALRAPASTRAVSSSSSSSSSAPLTSATVSRPTRANAWVGGATSGGGVELLWRRTGPPPRRGVRGAGAAREERTSLGKSVAVLGPHCQSNKERARRCVGRHQDAGGRLRGASTVVGRVVGHTHKHTCTDPHPASRRCRPELAPSGLAGTGRHWRRHRQARGLAA